MPGFDKTGPQGKGPVTGGGRGTCRQNEKTGKGQGRGQGRGRCAGSVGGRGMGQGGGVGRRPQQIGPDHPVNEQTEKTRNDADATTKE